MRIAFVSTYYKPTIGGVEKVVEELATRYVKLGHHVDVFCSDSDKHNRIKKKFEVIDGVNVYRSRYWVQLGLNTNIAPGTIWRLLWNRYDVVHSHVSQHDYFLWSGIISFLKGRPHVHTTHCPWTDKFRPGFLRIPLWFAENVVNYVSFFFCSKIIAITPWEIPTLKRWTSEKKIQVIPNGMDKILFEKIKPNNFKKKLVVKKKLVLFFGRLHPTKAPHILAEVAKEVVKERNDIDFVFVGPDEGEMERVKSIVKGVERIHVIGGLFGKKNIAEMYQASDVYVLPSYREGLPLTLFEAMASGLPIVATPCNGVPYEVEENVNGFLVPFGDKKLLKERIYQVLDDKKLAKKLSLNNVEKSKSYTWEKITQDTLDVYRELGL
ncbi:MAG: glycosyltransferase family 4 protein [Nanoarchaeota archaeon]|nr:glycosyltransferase family 4 protein [Nanoarchaeota archaeon]